MKHLSAFVLIVSLIILPSCKFFKSWGLFGKKDRALAEMQARQDSIRVADSLRNAQDLLMAIERARQDSINRADEERRLNENKYNIIIGSFVTPEYAKILLTEYNNQGYNNAQIIKVDGSKFELVAAEGHKSFRKAVERLYAFQDTVQIDSWMYIRP
jgi:hypothetical protein